VLISAVDFFFILLNARPFFLKPKLNVHQDE